MRRTKIIAFSALASVSALLLVASFTPRAEARPSEGYSEAGPVMANFVGLGGMLFQPGQKVEIKWTLEGEGVKYLETHPWGECELLFSANGGQTWTRITPHLSVTRRGFEWTVPNLFTRQGVIALQIGIEGEGDFYTFPSESFMVLGRH